MGDLAVKNKPATTAPTPSPPATAASDVLVDPTVAAASSAVSAATVTGGKKKAAEPKKPPFDPYKASPEVKALLLQLSNTPDAKAAKPIIASLKAAGVPMDLIHGITQGDEGIIDKAKLLAKGPGIHSTTLGADGSVAKEFHLDKKHIEWDGTDQRFDANWDKKKATYEHKKSNTVIEAGAADGGGYAKGAWGDEATGNGRHEAVAKMTSKNGETMYGGQYSSTYTGDPDSKADDRSQVYQAGVVTKGDAIGGKASAVIKNGDESHTANAKALFGKKSSVNADYTHVDGKNSEQYKGSWTQSDGNGAIDLSTLHKHNDGASTSSGSLNMQYGDKTGASGKFGLKRKDWTLNGEGRGFVTNTDKANKTEFGGKGSFSLLGDNAKSKNDDLTFNLSGGGVLDRKAGNQLYKGGLGVDWGEGSANGSFTQKNDDAGFSTSNFGFDAKHSLSLNDASKKMLNMGASGAYNATNEPGAEDTWNAKASIGISEGDKNNKTSHALDLSARKTKGESIIKDMGLPSTIPGEGYGNQFSLGTKHVLDGGNTFTTGADFGRVGDFNLGALNAGWSQTDGKKTTGSANLSFGAASNGTHSGMMGKGDFSLNPNDNWSFGAGGGFQTLSGPQGTNTTGFGYGEAGYSWGKDKGLNLKTGFASDGTNSTLFPELEFKANKDLSASVMGAIPTNGNQASVGGKLNLPGGISVMGGYGDMNALTNPYQGNSGMAMPGAFNGANQMGYGNPTGGGAFVGVSADLIKTYRSIFKK